MNHVIHQRIYESPVDTIGTLYLHDQLLCFTLEDQFQRVKVPGETRIPAGDYRVTLRTWGTHHEDYLKRYGAQWEKGMLWLMDVPGFKDILFHIGNSFIDTKGCILCGFGLNIFPGHKSDLSQSRIAYEYAYPRLVAALEADGLTWSVRDLTH